MTMMLTNSKSKDICYNKTCPKFKICPLGYEKVIASMIRSIRKNPIKMTKHTFLICKIFDRINAKTK